MVPHARILSRTFERQEYMEEIYSRWITGDRSITALTDKSETFKSKFTELVKQESAGESEVGTMHWANHRHESMTKPLGRSVKHIYAQLGLAAWIATTRHGNPEAQD